MTSTYAARSSFSHAETLRQVASFGSIGAVSTAAYVVLYAWLRDYVPAGPANAVALIVTAVGNTAANRWLTFGVRGRDGLARDHAAGLLALGAALAITSLGLAALDFADPRHGRLSELVVLVGANALATLVRFLLLRLTLSRPASRAPTSPAVASVVPAATANLSATERA